jgi:hypothetical protein
MKPIKQRVGGEVLAQGDAYALVLRTLQPDAEDSDLVYLRFPFLTRGPGDVIFPAMVVDDWGREMRSLGLYKWVRENGDRFPRSEIFGYEADGRETQVFLREMELLARLPCYAYAAPESAVTQGHLISAVLIEEPGTETAARIKRPPDLSLPLSAARVSWWHIPPGLRDIDLARLENPFSSG